MKTCNKCNKDKPLNLFGKNKAMKSGYINTCKACISSCRGPRTKSNKAVTRQSADRRKADPAVVRKKHDRGRLMEQPRDYLYIDIETVPGHADWIRERMTRSVKCPGSIKLETSIAKWEREKRPAMIEAALAKTSLDATFGEICCISWAINDNPVSGVIRGLAEPEKPMIEQFLCALEKQLAGIDPLFPLVWCGHNIARFDLRYIWQRLRINGIKTSIKIPYDAKPWSNEIFDTLHEWDANSFTNHDLDTLCKVFNLQGKETGITGADVYPMMLGKQEQEQEVLNYCMGDVAATRALHQAMTGPHPAGHRLSGLR